MGAFIAVIAKVIKINPRNCQNSEKLESPMTTIG